MKYKIPQSKNSAFTLVEMMVVIIIISLIVAVVVGGGKFVDASKRNSVVSALAKYKSAFNQFKDIYMSFPGDMPDATISLPNSVTSGCNGDGDGFVEAAPSYAEGVCAWNHLTQGVNIIDGRFTGALVSGDVVAGTNAPAGNYKDSGYVFSGWNSTNNVIFFANIAELMDLYDASGSVTSPNSSDNIAVLTANDAYKIDEKIDDALPQSGDLLGYHGISGSTACYSSGEYKRTDSSNDCMLVFKME
jgi:prepilin-type N-terminal cleavage/methylation domain-containing protein